MDRHGGASLAERGVHERLPLAALAARGALIERVVDGHDLSRFSRLCKPGDGIQVRLSFSREEDGSIRIAGGLTASLRVDCHRCRELVAIELSDEFSVAAVMDEAHAARIGARQDVLHLTTEDPTLAQLIEDELILALPQRPCTDLECDKAPPLSYPARAPDADNPFRSLERLKKEP